MHAIIPNVPARSRSYAWGCISVNPDPPRVGEVTVIDFPLLNPGPNEVVVDRIEAKVARFGIGVEWEELPAIGPFHLLPDERYVEHATALWTPREGGHRCVRAEIHVHGIAEACHVGRNLHVIEAAAGERNWSVPFRLGNPTPKRAPIRLQVEGNNTDAVDAVVRAAGRALALDEPLWLDAGEEVDAELLLWARTGGALSVVRTVEANIRGELIDGIHVTVHRRVHAQTHAAVDPARLAGLREPVGAYVH
jgi:hypothetical protein